MKKKRCAQCSRSFTPTVGFQKYCLRCREYVARLSGIKAAYAYKRRQITLDADWQNKTRRKYRYGITDGQYDQVLLAQDGRCAICYADDKILHIDHCHITGQFRGLLCNLCNKSLGMIEDSIPRLNRAIDYLDGKLSP